MANAKDNRQKEQDIYLYIAIQNERKCSLPDYELVPFGIGSSPTTSPSITLFAREVVELETKFNDETAIAAVFIQGGPGGKSPRPMPRFAWPWMVEALKNSRAHFIDQLAQVKAVVLINI